MNSDGQYGLDSTSCHSVHSTLSREGKKVSWIFYELKKIPDLSLAKYQSLEEMGVEGVLQKHGAFLRQWQRLSVLLNIDKLPFSPFNFIKGGEESVVDFLRTEKNTGFISREIPVT